MASGADTSARMISLAFNIAVMGMVLVQGIESFLRSVEKDPTTIPLHALAQSVASGRLSGLGADATFPGKTLSAALASGFGWVMTYGAVGAFFTAAASALVFAPPKASSAAPQPHRAPKAPGTPDP
jgi:uncharacterized membrane protein YbjE (DUF340 family)